MLLWQRMVQYTLLRRLAPILHQIRKTLFQLLRKLKVVYFFNKGMLNNLTLQPKQINLICLRELGLLFQVRSSMFLLIFIQNIPLRKHWYLHLSYLLISKLLTSIQSIMRYLWLKKMDKLRRTTLHFRLTKK